MESDDPLFVPGETLYREHILDHYKHPRNHGRLKRESLALSAKNPLCGDQLVFHVLVKKKRIADIAFEGQGCAISTAAASLLTESVKGKTLADVRRMTSEEHLQRIHVPLGPVRMKCALLSFHLLKDAVKRYQGERK